MSLGYLAAEVRQCVGKHVHLSAGDAKRAARQSQTFHGGRAMTPYPCPHCSTPDQRRWHIGHAARHWQIDAARKAGQRD